MRILLLSTYFEPDIAANGVIMTRLAQELARLGHKLTVVTSKPHYDTNRIWDEYRGGLVHHERLDAMDIYRLYLYVPRHKDRSFGRLINYGSFNSLSALVGTLAGKHDVILVPSPPLTNGLSADLIGRLRGTPFVYNVQDIWPDVAVRMGVMTNPRIVGFFQRVERYIYGRARAVVVISEGFRHGLLAKGVPDRKIEVIPNFADADFVRPLPKENSFSAAHGLADKFVVLFAGNVGNSQGLETVLEAALHLREQEDTLFLIVGNGASRPELEAQARALALPNVRFLPYQPRDALPEMYATADVCLVPLRKGFTGESVPSKVYTITASARPIIASVDEGSDTWQFVRTADCGLTVAPEDPQLLAGAVRRLYSDAALRERLGRNGRQHMIKHYTPQAVAQRYHELLTRLS